MKLNELSFEIIQKCPNNCIHCSSNSNINCNHIIHFDIFKNTIDDAIGLGLTRLCISGGEPFLHPNLLDMVEYAKKYNIEVYIYTSGITLNTLGNYKSLNNDDLINLANLNVDKLIFNLESADEKLYDEIMGTKNCFNLLKESIQKTKRNRIYTELHFVPMKINYKQIRPVVELAKKLDVDKISFLRLVVQARAKKNENLLKLSVDEYEEVKILLKSIEDMNDGIAIRKGIPLSIEEESKKCNAGNEKLIIRYDGSVYPCEAFKYLNCVDGRNIIVPDNINKKRLKDIYIDSPFLSVLRNEIKEFKSKEKRCESCPAQWRLEQASH